MLRRDGAKIYDISLVVLLSLCIDSGAGRRRPHRPGSSSFTPHGGGLHPTKVGDGGGFDPTWGEWW